MQKIFTLEDIQRIRQAIADRYRQVAVTPAGRFRFPTGSAGLAGQNYDPAILQALPQQIQDAYCGVGNPFSLGPVRGGESVLDVGCGAGVDSLFAARMTGPQGRVVGLDMTPEMLARARRNAELAGMVHLEFQEGSAEDLPFAEAQFDVVISNGVFNLVPDKSRALREAFRVLKPAGRLMLADQVLVSAPPADT